jgi:hypothetical protein
MGAGTLFGGPRGADEDCVVLDVTVGGRMLGLTLLVEARRAALR